MDNKINLPENLVPPVKLSDVERVIASVKRVTNEDIDISFEFLLMALFPSCWENIQAEMNRQHTLGYIAGLSNKNEI